MTFIVDDKKFGRAKTDIINAMRSRIPSMLDQLGEEVRESLINVSGGKVKDIKISRNSDEVVILVHSKETTIIPKVFNSLPSILSRIRW